MTKFTIVGGSGFVGTNLCQALEVKGHSFEIIDIKPSRRFPEHCKIADIRDPEAIRTAITGDVIVHLAAVHRDDVRDQSEYHRTNVDGTANIVAVAEERRIKRILFTSSVAVYGFAPPGTDEDGAIAPFNEYGRTKFLAEEVLRAWYDISPGERKLVILRPTVIFGDGNRGNVYNLLRQINSGFFVMVGSGRNRKSLAYVDNVVAFIEYCLSSQEPYMLANYVDSPDFDMNSLVSLVKTQITGRPARFVRLPFWVGLMLGYLADGVARVSGRHLPISALRVRKFCADTQFRARTLEQIDFVAPVALDEALRRTVDREFCHPTPGSEEFFSE